MKRKKLREELQQIHKSYTDMVYRFAIVFNRTEAVLFPNGLYCNMESSLEVLKDIQEWLNCKVLLTTFRKLHTEATVYTNIFY